MEFGLVILSALMFVYAVASKRLSATFVTGPLLFVTAGWATGPEGLDVIRVATDRELIKILLETTLVLVLFTDAMGINTTRWREEAAIPVRLLGIGLPLTLLAGWTIAFVMFGDLNVWEAGLIAIILAPTDAALGQAVVSNPRVPERIRQGLNIESGLNDGISLPIFFVFLDAALSVESSVSIGVVVNAIIKQVIVATSVGVVLGWLGAKAIRHASERQWVTSGWRQLSLLILALGAWALGDALGGSGFISAWVGGLVVGILLKRSFDGIQDVTEDAGHLLTILSFFVFGSVILAPVVAAMTWKVAAYAVLSLTVVRILPVVVAMLGTRLKPPSLLYLGWFGPRSGVDHSRDHGARRDGASGSRHHHGDHGCHGRPERVRPRLHRTLGLQPVRRLVCLSTSGPCRDARSSSGAGLSTVGQAGSSPRRRSIDVRARGLTGLSADHDDLVADTQPNVVGEAWTEDHLAIALGGPPPPDGKEPGCVRHRHDLFKPKTAHDSEILGADEVDRGALGRVEAQQNGATFGLLGELDHESAGNGVTQDVVVGTGHPGKFDVVRVEQLHNHAGDGPPRASNSLRRSMRLRSVRLSASSAVTARR